MALDRRALRPNLAGACNQIFITRQFFETHWTSGVKPVGAYPNFGAKSKFAAVIESCGRIPKYSRRINLSQELLGGQAIIRDNRIAVVRAIGFDMFYCFIQVFDCLYGQNEVQKFRAPVLLGRRLDSGTKNLLNRVIAAQLDTSLPQSVRAFGKKSRSQLFMAEQRLYGVANTGALALPIDDEIPRHFNVGGTIYVDRANAIIMLDHRHPRSGSDRLD